MSDNRATELTATERLRALLDEHGVEHFDGTERTLWGYEPTGEDTGIYRFAANEIRGGFLQFDMFRITPEQAIAATLGEKPRDRTEEWLLKACIQATQDYVAQLECERDELKSKLEATTLGSGKLTADDVLNAVYKHGARWQAIADELNATLWSGLNPDGLPSGLTISDDGTLLNWRGGNYVKQSTLGSGVCDNISDPPEGFLCSECGWGDFAEPSHLLTTAKFTNNDRGPNYCPNCGKAVKS